MIASAILRKLSAHGCRFTSTSVLYHLWMDTPATSRKRPAPASVGRISPPTSPSLKLLHSQVQGLHGRMAAQERLCPHRKNHFSIEGGRNREKKCRIPRISPPFPPYGGRGAYLRDTMPMVCDCNFFHFYSPTLSQGRLQSLDWWTDIKNHFNAFSVMRLACL